MTTIAWDGVCLAADRMTTMDSTKVEEPKLFLLPDGTAFAGAGQWQVVEDVIDWLSGHAEKPQNVPPDSFAAILVKPDGSVWTMESRLVLMPVRARWYTVGSGHAYAATALHLGYDAIDAVLIAGEVSTCAGFGGDYVSCSKGEDGVPEERVIVHRRTRNPGGMGARP